ncbi:hypothetical protein A7U60_g1391 [Sanghuangporus baumii]|uniref:Uncharacterized protein n=1 Tax=Sanghuangporus baumii TaxID=108892 RepID=A0A9Q5N9A8_SANBA|nr:hypothetical protein A7U60_g1391 [Sanghuangporus baumii]
MPKSRTQIHIDPVFSSHFSGFQNIGKDNKYFDFRFTNRYNEGVEHRLIHLAETQEHGTIFHKFTRALNRIAHVMLQFRSCTANSWLSRGSRGLKYVGNGVFPARSAAYSNPGTGYNELWTLIHTFHEKCLVHGDLHHPDIMNDGYCYLTLTREESYPTANLCKELMEGRSNNGLKITKEDDNRILTNTLNALPRSES